MKKLLIFFLCFFAVHSIEAQGLINQGLNVINKKKQEQELKEKQAAENLKQAEADAKKVENRRKIESSFPHLIDSTSGDYVKGSPFANKFHKDNVGKILFSTTKTDALNLTAKSFTDTILFGQGIDTRYFLPTSLCNYLVYDSVNVTLDVNTHRMSNERPNSSHYFVIVTINGERIERPDRLETMDQKKLTTFRDPIYSSTSKQNNDFYREFLNGIPVGTSKVKVELWGGSLYKRDGNRTMKPICTGEFTMIRKNDKPLAFLEKFSDNKSMKKDAAVEAAALKAMTLAMQQEGKTENYTKVLILETDWKISNNEYTGAILSRSLPVVGFFKKEDGKCYERYFTIRQSYAGGGNYSTGLTVDGPKTEAFDIDCE